MFMAQILLMVSPVYTSLQSHQVVHMKYVQLSDVSNTDIHKVT